MYRIDELLGVATFATVAMVVAIAVAPVRDGVTRGEVATMERTSTAPIVQLPSVDVVARRSVEVARIEREESLAASRTQPPNT